MKETTLNRAINSTFFAIKHCENNDQTHWHEAFHAARAALSREGVTNSRAIARRIADLVSESNTGFDETWETIYSIIEMEFSIS